VLIALTKNTTIVGTIGVMEASSVMKELINEYGSEAVTIFMVFAGIFVAVLVPLGYGFSWAANRWAVKR